MKFRQGLLLIVFAMLCGWIGYSLGERRLNLAFKNWKPAVVVNQNPYPKTAEKGDFDMFWKVWQKTSHLYVDKSQLDSKKMTDGAISGMVAAIGDPYTAYFPIQQNKEFKEEIGGSFGGVGMELGYKEKKLSVVAPLDDTPAAKAGILAGDYILRIMDEKNKVDRITDGIAVAEAVKLIRGEIGTSVKLTLFRDGQEKPFDAELVRAEIVVKSIKLTFDKNSNNKDIAVIKFSRFGDRTQTEWNSAVSEIVNKGVDGVLVDMRNNPGGYLEMAVYTAGEFVVNGKNIVTQRYGDGREEENKVERNGRLLKTPLVVLVNGGSASASEIFAGALQDYKRAKIVGTQTFGKGSVQQPEEMGDGSAIHVTIAKWIRPNGDWIDKKGVTPDVKIEVKDGENGFEKQLKEALELI